MKSISMKNFLKGKKMLDYEIINDVEDWVPKVGDKVRIIGKAPAIYHNTNMIAEIFSTYKFRKDRYILMPWPNDGYYSWDDFDITEFIPITDDEIKKIQSFKYSPFKWISRFLDNKIIPNQELLWGLGGFIFLWVLSGFIFIVLFNLWVILIAN